jgi:hypothetical protein
VTKTPVIGFISQVYRHVCPKPVLADARDFSPINKTFKKREQKRQGKTSVFSFSHLILRVLVEIPRLKLLKIDIACEKRHV